MRVVVGLGNPGAKYSHTRHNVGFMVVEELARRWRVVLDLSDRTARSAWAHIEGERVRLVEPLSYMNMSGEALNALEPLPTADTLIVVHDDIDLECGHLRVKLRGGTAGHHGLDSIVASFGEDFTRVRLGVGRPPAGHDVASFVLSGFDRGEHQLIDAGIRRAADAVECIAREGEHIAMNIFNRRHDIDRATDTPIGRN